VHRRRQPRRSRSSWFEEAAAKYWTVRGSFPHGFRVVSVSKAMRAGVAAPPDSPSARRHHEQPGADGRRRLRHVARDQGAYRRGRRCPHLGTQHPFSRPPRACMSTARPGSSPAGGVYSTAECHDKASSSAITR
jgi:hypothetical protein